MPGLPRPRWPEWTQTIRFRLTLAYSTLLFGLAALVVSGIYLGVARGVGGTKLSETLTLRQGFRTPDGRFVPVQSLEVAKVSDFEAAVNARTMKILQTYSLWTLLALFLASLAIGWWLSGRALRPIRRITATTQEITGSDLSGRIRLRGPDDELRRLADTIDAMLDRLEESFTAQRQMVDDASHELRNPLAVIRTNVEAVLGRDDVPAAEREHATAVVSRATTRMAGLVEDLLATARRAAPAFVERDVDVAELAREAVEEAALAAGERGLRVRADGAGPGTAVVIADRDALRRAVDNLLDNALRFSPPGGVVTVRTGASPGWVCLAVRDEGPGIAPGAARRVFDRFYSDNPAWTRAASGSRTAAGSPHAGLGLAIVRQIAESHGGRVELDSDPGAGSTFTLWLPARGEAAQEPAAGPDQVRAGAGSVGKSVPAHGNGVSTDGSDRRTSESGARRS